MSFLSSAVKQAGLISDLRGMGGRYKRASEKAPCETTILFIINTEKHVHLDVQK